MRLERGCMFEWDKEEEEEREEEKGRRQRAFKNVHLEHFRRDAGFGREADLALILVNQSRVLLDLALYERHPSTTRQGDLQGKHFDSILEQ